MSDSNILVVKLADVGDVLTATPALRMLRDAKPEANVTVLVTPETAFIPSELGLADQVICFDKHRFDNLGSFRAAAGAFAAGFAVELRAQRFETVILLHHLTTRAGTAKYFSLAAATGAENRLGLDNGRGWFLTDRIDDAGFGAHHEVEYAASLVGLLGIEGKPGGMEFPGPSAEATSAIDEMVPAKKPDRPRIAIHPGSGAYSVARRWFSRRFHELAGRLTEELAADVIVVGGPDEIGLGADVAGDRSLNLAGRTTLEALGALLRSCDLLVSNDSGVAQIAAAVDIPVVSIFGPSNAGAWAPWRPQGKEWKTVVIARSLECQPCFYVGKRLGRPEGCPPRTCLQQISVDEVFDAAESLLKHR